MMKWQLKELSDSWETVSDRWVKDEEWFGESTKVRRLKLCKNVLVENIKLKLTISKCTLVKSVNEFNSLAVVF